MTASLPDPVRIGILGCADIARRRMLPAFAADPDSTVVAIASRDGARARQLADQYGCAAVAGYEALLAAPEVEAVYVPLPLALHAEWIERALLAGKHVLGEKPLTPYADATARLFALARSRGLMLAENFMFPYHHQHQQVRRLVGDGAIGELRSFTGVFAIPPPPRGDIRYRADLDGGALLDIAVQPLLAAWYFLGPELEVRGARLRRHPVHGVDTGGAILLAVPDGTTAQTVFGMEHAYRSAYELWGSAGRILLERAYAPARDYRPVLRLERPDGTENLVLEAEDQCLNAVHAFSDAVRNPPYDLPEERCLTLARLLADIQAADQSGPSGVARTPRPAVFETITP